MTKRLGTVDIDQALRLIPPLLERGKFDEARRWSDEFVRRRVTDPRGWNFLARSLERLGQEFKARRCYQMALILAPGTHEILVNLAKIQRLLGQTERSIRSYRKALTCSIDDSEIQLGLGICYLTLGDLATGFALFEHRAGRLGLLRQIANHELQQWDGSSVAGKRFLCIGEQGAGDTLMFARYVRLLAEQGAEVVIACSGPLRRLFEGLDGVSEVVSKRLTTRVDMCDLVMSLPYRFGTNLKTIPAPPRYIEPPVSTHPLPENGRLRVGLCWAGNSKHPLDRKRSMAFEALQPILGVLDVDYYAFQFGARAVPARDDGRVLDLTPNINDYADTAGFLDQMDLMISVDTSVAHLSGALGVPTWVLLASSTDWRWMLDGETTPWYPSHRLYRQQVPDDWSGVVARVRDDLVQRVTDGRLRRSRTPVKND